MTLVGFADTKQPTEANGTWPANWLPHQLAPWEANPKGNGKVCHQRVEGMWPCRLPYPNKPSIASPISGVLFWGTPKMVFIVVSLLIRQKGGKKNQQKDTPSLGYKLSTPGTWNLTADVKDQFPPKSFLCWWKGTCRAPPGARNIPYANLAKAGERYTHCRFTLHERWRSGSFTYRRGRKWGRGASLLDTWMTSKGCK